LLERGGVSLKAFVPQLQSTFVKCLSDPARDVRSRAVIALGRLIPQTARVDPLVLDLTGLCSKAESTAIRLSVLEALGVVLQMGGSKATPAALDSAREALLRPLFDEDEAARGAAAKSISRLAWFLDPASATDLALDLLDTSKGSDGAERACGRLLGLGALFHGASQHLLDVRDEAFTVLLQGCRADSEPLNAAAAGYVCFAPVSLNVYISCF
jgi:hypothetical protein